MFLLLMSTTCWFGIVLSQVGDPVQVDTEYGPVIGRTIELHNGKRISSFHAIPYAREPTGDLRFRAPQAPEPWEEPLPAHELGPSCHQRLVGGIYLTHPFWSNFEEDCLHLDITAPEIDEDVSGYPVIVFIHGGAFQSGANIQYPGHFIAMKDVVVVVMNYRLNNLGFAFTNDGSVDGNAGLLDQAFALEWVQRNIGNFGGDPNQVTLVGQSAGAASAGMHIVSPKSQGLFHKAILQSGCEESLWAYNSQLQEPENYIKQVAEQLDCESEDNGEMMECLRSKNAGRVARADVTCADGFFCLGMAPVVDGEFLPENPAYIRNRSEHAQVPIMSGQTREDGMIYMLAFLLTPNATLNGTFNHPGYTREEFLDIIDYAVDFFAPNIPDEEFAQQIREALVFQYSPWPHIDDPADNRYAINEIVTDTGFGFLQDMNRRSQAEDADVYEYVYGFRGPAFWLPDWMGVFHSMDLEYTFGYPFLLLNPEVRNDSGIEFGVFDYTEEDLEFADFTLDLWTNFAKYGDPTPEPITPPGGDSAIRWEKSDNSEMNYFLFDNNGGTRTGVDYRKKEHHFWLDYLRCMVYPDFDVPPIAGMTQCEIPYDFDGDEKKSMKANLGQSRPSGRINMQDVLRNIDDLFIMMVEERLQQLADRQD